jgi:Glycosyl hydrolase catalytic core
VHGRYLVAVRQHFAFDMVRGIAQSVLWSRVRQVVEQQPSDIEFVPMIWTGSDPNRVKYLIDTYVLPAYEAGQVRRLLGYNEPDKKNQANLDVTKAVASWPTLEATGMPLGGPSVTTSGVGSWMKDWNEYAFKYGLRVDYVAVHWYGEPSILAFQKYMRHMYELNGGQTPLLITEFAPADWSASSPEDSRFTRAQVLTFMQTILPWLEHPDQAHWIYGYAWFPFRTSFGPGTCSSLFEEDGTPTLLGQYYRSVTPDNPYGDQSISY